MRAVFAAALLGLAGCTTLPPAPTTARVETRQATTWIVSGRIGVVNGDDQVAGQIRWQHRGIEDEILLTSPLGHGVARIVRNMHGVALEIPGEPTRRAADVQALTQSALGYALPVEGLVSWVQGRPHVSRPAEPSYDAAGRLERLLQDGWTIDYLQYSADGRPRKLALARDALAIRLVIDRWEAGE